ncbi:MtrB/PioB family outer membrane beta-barrel protein [Geobacter sp. AOG1]|uniref:MtrB/PioB family outer membrane beta-barrel protein n=1 Tax=Geobacter sp. AOG1 TaxID=1566346 RepID=UPI001CC36754|nr:MtrB/PioB family outer membrane beta-barrel protein [Geobacter sp. AOG1]GFE58215.1 outer membrane channel lipoprotein [Geobacter sp. AOG1]
MIAHIKFVQRLLLAALLVIVTAFPLRAEDATAAGGNSAVGNSLLTEDGSDGGEGEGPLSVDVPLPENKVETHTFVGASAGYRFFNLDKDAGRAAQYEYLHSSPVFSAGINSLGMDHKFVLDGMYLNEDDYFGDLSYDYKGAYRLHLRTESLFHNLFAERLFAPDIPNLFGANYLARDLAPGARYGLRSEQDLAEFRYKLNEYPVHLNLGYWRLAKSGNSQLIFADHAFEPLGANNTVYAASRRIDRQTHEGNLGVDAHLGPVDIIYGFKIRQFDNRADTPRDFFIARPDTANEFIPRLGGYQQHNEEPDSRYYAHTVKLHSSLTGGIVGAASYTYGKRENRSSLTDVGGADRTSDILQNVAGDFVYTPCMWFSAALKYRRQDVDRNSLSTITSLFADTPGHVLSVRPAIDTDRDVVTATFSVRPNALVTFKGEYKGEFTQRENLASWVRPGIASSPGLPENTAVNRGTFTVLSRPVKGLRLKALYGYTAVNHPAYGNSYGQKHEGQLLATYTYLARWGATAYYRVARENNDQTTMATLSLFAPSVVYELPRQKRTNNATLSVWVSPLDKLTMTASYSLLRWKTDQSVLFSATQPGSNGGTAYTNQSQIFSLNSVYRYNDKLDLSLALQQIHSRSDFDPLFLALSPTESTLGIQDGSKVKTIESSVSARADYHVTKNVTCSVDYSYRDYDNRYASLYDGTVQIVTAQVSTKW